MNDTAIPHPPHPYYPLEAEIVGYLANEYSMPKLLSLFAAGCFVILSAASLVTQRTRPSIPTSELAVVMWFVLCTWNGQARAPYGAALTDCRSRLYTFLL